MDALEDRIWKSRTGCGTVAHDRRNRIESHCIDCRINPWTSNSRRAKLTDAALQHETFAAYGILIVNN